MLPSVVHQTLPPSLAVNGIIGLRRAGRIGFMPSIVTREVEEARRSMIGEYASLVQLQASESTRQTLSRFMAGMRAVVRL